MYRDFSGNYSVTGNLKSAHCNTVHLTISDIILLLRRILTFIFVS